MTFFDDAIDRRGMLSQPYFRDAAIDVNDTLALCWASAQTVFGKAAKPEHAIALLPIVIERADGIRQREMTEQLAHTQDGASPPPDSAD